MQGPSPVGAPPLLEIRNAEVWRGQTRALRNLTLTIGQGENVAILGPNGAGKTTLLRLLTRELYPVRRARTAVRVLGRDSWNVWELRRQLGVVSHDLQVDYHRGVRGRDVVLSAFSSSIGVRGVPHEFSGEEQAAAAAMMVQLGIAHLAETPFAHLSTGQQRRLLLARSLVSGPGTLILDEPLAGLDLAAAFSYLVTIEKLMANGVAVVLVTHHVNEIPPGIDRVVLLRDGELIADGPRRELITATSLTALYGVPVRVVESGGYSVALPADA
jgi:iron complex transport system ATP-binding protein